MDEQPTKDEQQWVCINCKFVQRIKVHANNKNERDKKSTKRNKKCKRWSTTLNELVNE